MMAMFISDNSDSSPPIGHHHQQPASSSLEGNVPLSRSGGEQSSRYENVASSVAPSHRPSCPESFLLHRLSSPRSSLLQLQLPALPTPPLSPGTLSSHSRSRRALSLYRPGTCFAKAKSFYKHSPLRHFGPWLLLVFYALLGALLFFWLESANERALLQKENAQLERLRQETLQKLAKAGRGYLDLMAKYGRQVLVQFERDLARTKSPDALAWDFWGALFYVQTVFTTIGYGNITPRTRAGQAMSILYAIIGIPLVLALLSQTSKKLTLWLSQKWISYRRTVNKHVKRKKPKTMGQREAEEGASQIGGSSEEGQNKGEEGEAEETTTESRTIPVWLALTIVGGYVCTIAAIFLVWESRWSYFTSFYFICISCLTIGLGDVVPDHPHMLILMFVFVIFGLSFVSMLISVIQIKMEEWLYRMLIRMQKEYQKALDGITDPAERERIISQMYAQEPWYLRDLAPLCISEKQSAKLDTLADKFERVMLDTNTRAIQTEESLGIGAKASISEGSGEDELMRTALEEEKSQQQQQWSGPKSGQSKMASGESALIRTGSFRSANSVSDATSLPMDPASVAPRPCGQTQTEKGIWQPMGQMISREAQTVVSPPPLRKKMAEKGIGTERCKMESRGVSTMEQRPKCQTQGTQMRPTMMNKRVDTDGLVERKESGIGTEPAAKMECREVQTVGILKKKETKGRLARADSIDEDRGRNNRGVQSSPPSFRHCKTQTDPPAILDYVEMVEGPSQLRERSESIQVVVDDEMEDMLDLAYLERRPAKQDLVIQTDDSYLRIARRLDNLRTAKSEINIYCTGVGIPKRAPGRRKSLRFLEPAVQQIRDSFRRHGKGGGGDSSSPMSEGERKNADEEDTKEGTTTATDMPEQSQSLSPMPVAKRRKHVRLPPEQ